MAKLLLIQGGYRIGDAFHITPIIHHFWKQGYDIDWVTGTYEECSSVAIAKIFGERVNVIIRNDNFPTDLNSRIEFLNAVKKEFDYSKYDLVYDNPRGSNEFEPDISYDNSDTFYPEHFLNKRITKDYIVVQCDSKSYMKRVDGLFKVNWPLPVYSVGGCGERIIPSSNNFTGKPFFDVIELIRDARLYVGIHSAATCAAYYTGTPLICVDYGKNYNFSSYGHKAVIHLYDLPGTPIIQSAVDKMITTSNPAAQLEESQQTHS